MSSDVERNEENYQCLLKNIEQPLIDRIYLILQGEDKPILPKTDKIEYVHLGKRPQFSDFFEITNSFDQTNIRFIIANSDIYFDETLSLLNKISRNNRIITLTRWDLQYDGSLVFYNKYLSQDTWIYTGKINPQIGRYFIGQHGCDNRLLAEFYEHGMSVFNPSLSVKSIHVHMSQLRPYFNDPNYKYVEPPYKYSLPSGLTHPIKLLLNRFRNNNKIVYSLEDYYYIRFEYFWFISLNKLQKINSNIFKRLISFPVALYYLILLKLNKR